MPDEDGTGPRIRSRYGRGQGRRLYRRCRILASDINSDKAISQVIGDIGIGKKKGGQKGNCL